MNLQNMQKKGFTLVELVVVMGVLITLGTIGFLSYNDYLYDVRDAARVTQLESIRSGIETYGIGETYPFPDDHIEIQSEGGVIAYQGYVGENVLESIGFTASGKDPKFGTYLSYYVGKNKTQFQIMGYLERNELLSYNGSKNVHANAVPTYSNMYINVSGEDLGILTGQGEYEKIPAQEMDIFSNSGVLDLSGTHSGVLLQANFNTTDTFVSTSDIISYSLAKKLNSKYDAPDFCQDGFIPVEGSSLYDQEGFCVSKYEMTYTEGDAPGAPNSSDGGSDWNSYNYDISKTIDSRNDYPISGLTQYEAIEACKEIGRGYHLITNKEWMTLARDISEQSENWTTGVVGTGAVFNGNSGNATFGCTESDGGRTYGAKTGGIENKQLDSSRSTCDEKKQLLLGNGEIIWDFSGNLKEHVNKSDIKSGAHYNVGTESLTNSSGYKNWNDIAIDSTELQKYGPVDSSYIDTYGMGNINDITAISPDNIIVRGGHADDDTYAGIFSLDLSYDDTDSSKFIGFRCVK